MTHTPYCHRGDNLSKKSRLAMSSIAAATEAVRVCIKKAQMFSMDHTSMSSSSFRSSSRSWAVSFSSFKKAATSLPAEP